MEKIFQQIKSVPDFELKHDLRKKIRNKLLVLKFQPYLLTVFSILIIDLFVIGFKVYFRMVESEALTVANVFIQDFELSSSYLFSFMSGLQEVLPSKMLIIWLLNFGLIAYMAKVIHYYRRELFNLYN